MGGVTVVTPLGEVETVPLAKIAPYPANARKIPSRAVEQTAKSIREFGWQQPIVTDPEFVVIVGHVRRLAALSLGLTDAPVVVARELTPEQVRAYRLMDNRSHDYTTWDYGLLARELDGLDPAFGDVLDLADWRAIVEAFEQLPADLDLPPGEASLFGLRFPVTVLFASPEQRDAAGPEILKLDGVLDVRYPGG